MIADTAGTEDAETLLRLKALSVAMIVDREGDGQDDELASTPNCFVEGVPAQGD